MLRTTLIALLALNLMFAFWTWTSTDRPAKSSASSIASTVGLKQLSLITPDSSPDAADQSDEDGAAAVEPIVEPPEDKADLLARLQPVVVSAQPIEVLSDAVPASDPAALELTSETVPEPTQIRTCVKTAAIEGDANAAQSFAVLSELIANPVLEKASEPKRPVFWVHIPAFETTREADDAVERLKARGIESFVITEPDELKNAVSLGVFRVRDRSDQLIGDLAGLGFETAVYEKPPVPAAYLIHGYFESTEDDVAASLERIREAAAEVTVEITDCDIAQQATVE